MIGLEKLNLKDQSRTHLTIYEIMISLMLNFKLFSSGLRVEV